MQNPHAMDTQAGQSRLLPTVLCDIVEAVIIESNCVLWLVHCGACSMNGGEERCMQGFGGET